jgi:prepilin-type processing-associated H-X9-DG protein
MMLRPILHLAALLVLLGSAAANAAEHAAIAPYLTDDVSSVVYLDLAKLNLPAIGAEMERLKLIPDSHLESSKQETVAIQAVLDELPKLGARRAYLLGRASDLFQGGPVLLVEVAEESQAQAVADWLKPWAKKAPALGDAAEYLPREFEAHGRFVIGAASRERIEAIMASRDESPRQEALDALAGAGDADVGWVAFGDVDSRRVFREMFPQLPAPFMEIDGPLLADHLKWIGLTFKLPPDPAVTVSLETTDKETAAIFETSVEKALTLAKGVMMMDLASENAVHRERAKVVLPVLAMLEPRVDGTRLTITFGDDGEEKAFLRDYLPQVAEGALATAVRRTRMTRFKHIALGMNNYDSARGALPAAASRDADGKPLLSWRVQILPYMDQTELWKKFRLDEPWDSEHNRKLVSQMPDVYADPDPTVRAAIGDSGLTTFVVPTGEGLVFGGKEGTKFRDLKDGSSNTILAVEVVPKRAVVWTKPDDWSVDLSDPLDGVKRDDRGFFTAAFCDGHVRILQNSTSPATLKAMLTRAAGDVAGP